MSKRLLRYVAIAAAVLVVGTIAVLAYRSLQVPYQAPTAASPLPAAGGCTPAPCADLRGYTPWVRNLAVTTHLLPMQIKFPKPLTFTPATPAHFMPIYSHDHHPAP